MTNMSMYQHPSLVPGVKEQAVSEKPEKKLKVLNLFGGPGTGKSTTMSLIFGTLKKQGVNCEMAPEWVKMAAWEGRSEVFKAQGYILEKQNWVLHRLRGKVELVVSDSPLLLAAAYSELYNHGVYASVNWRLHCKALFDTYDNFNVFIERQKAYNPAGRNQTEEEARVVDKAILKSLDELGVKYYVIKDSPTVHEDIIKLYREHNEKAS